MRRYIYKLNPYLWSQRTTILVFTLFLLISIPLYTAYGLSATTITDVTSVPPAPTLLPLAQLPAPKTISIPTVSIPPPSHSAPQTSTTAPSTPSIHIPKISLTSPLTSVGFKSGTHQPATPDHTVGYFNLTAAPGTSGTTFLLGHSPGIFSNLHLLTAGDTFTIATETSATTYRVIAAEISPLSDSNIMSRALRPHPQATSSSTLNLMTCIGTYDPAQSTYTSRLIVYTEKI
jgi:sortase (surface protein transpeptidase)